MAKEKIESEIVENLKSNVPQELEKQTKAYEKQTKAVEANTKAKEKNAKAGSSSSNTTKEDNEIIKAKKEQVEAVKKIATREESIASMTEEQLRLYEESLAIQRKKINSENARRRTSERRLDEGVKNREQRERKLALQQEREANAAKRADAMYLNAQARKESVEARNTYMNRRRTTKYQLGRGFISAGSYLGKNLPSPMGNITGTISQVVGAALANPHAIAAVGVTQLVKAVTELGKASVQAYGEIESIKTQLGVVYGNDTQANQAFTDISKYAVKSPFGISETAELATLLKQSGVDAANLMDTLKMLGDTAGGNMEKMKRIANNYAQIVSIGKASMLDMRQFAYAGIPIFEKVADELNVSQTALRNMISEGKVTSEVITKVFQDMTSEGGLFFEATSKGAETLKARLQNLKDTKQLALASIGEQYLRIGERTGNDALGNRGISLAENFYSKINKISTLKNLEKSVKTIENNSSEQERVKALIAYAEQTGQSKDVINALKEELKQLKNYTDPDKQRSIFYSLFEQYRGTESTDSTIGQLRKTVVDNRGEIERLQASKEFGGDWDVIDDKIKLLETAIATANDQIDILLKQKNITEDIRRGWLETKTINEQQTKIAEINDSSSKSTSVISNLAKMNELYQSTEEYKNKEQERLKNTLEESEKLLKEIAGHTKDGTNILNFDEVAGSKLQQYIRKGAVEGRKLATTADQKDSDKDWLILKNQIGTAYSSIISNFGKDSNLAQLEENARAVLVGLSPSNLNVNSKGDFYNRFNTDFYTAQQAAFSEYNKSVELKDDVAKAFWENIYDTITQSLIEYSSAGLVMGNWRAGLNGSGNQFVPLWKRIIQSATGIDHTAITSSSSAIDFYGSNLSTRNMTGNTISALAKEGLSVDEVRLLTGNRTVKTKLKDDTYVWQIDWEATRKGMTDFVSKLSASTTAIDTWTSGLEAERDVYANLLGSGILTPESNGVNKAMYISASKLAEGWTSEGEMGVNAFGEQLYNAEDQLVKEIKNGVAYGEDGLALQNQTLKISGNIYDTLETHLASIDKEIREANKVSARNASLANMQNNVLGSYLSNMGMRSAGYGLSNYIMNNPDEYQKWLNQNIDITGYKNQSELMSAFFNGDTDAIKRINEALKITNGEVLEFINTDLYTNLKSYNDNLEKINNVNSAYNTVLGLLNGSKSYDPSNIEGNEGLQYRWRDNVILQGLGIKGVAISDIARQGEDFRNSKIKELQSIASKGNLSEDEKNRIETLKEEIALTEELTEAKMRELIADAEKNNATAELLTNVRDIAKTVGKKSFLLPFETLGEDIFSLVDKTKEWPDYLEDGLVGIKKIGGELVANIGNEMATCGFRIASAAALESNWPAVAAGLGLAAAGGVASGLGSSLTNTQTNNKDETDKLQSLTDQIKALLEQARTDALYYENNLRHKEALGSNSKYTQKVNDAIIAPNGNVITTAPDDYLIATKQPQNLVSRNASPTINFTVVDNAGVNVKQQKKQNADGSVEIIAIIESVMDNYIASEKSDGAFNARQRRTQGTSFIM